MPSQTGATRQDEPAEKGERGVTPRLAALSTLSGEVSLDDIIRKPVKALRPLPIGSRDDVFVEGASHVLAANPKGGKSTLMQYLSYAWAVAGHRILYLSEEFELVWQLRTAILGLEPSGAHFKVVYALGLEPGVLLNRTVGGDEDIIIVDTIRTLLGVKSLANSDEVVAALKPWLNGVTKSGRTLVFGHHFTKDKDTIAGGGGLLAAVDTVIKYQEVAGDDTLRVLSVRSRLPLAGRFGLRMVASQSGTTFVVEEASGVLTLTRDEQMLYEVIYTEAQCKAAEEQIGFLEEETKLGAAGSSDDVAAKLAHLKDIKPRTVRDLEKATGWPESRTKYVLKQLVSRGLVKDVTGHAGVGGRGLAAAYVRVETDEDDE